MRYNGRNPGMNPGQMDTGGMQSPMNPMQKSQGMPQGPQVPQAPQMPKVPQQAPMQQQPAPAGGQAPGGLDMIGEMLNNQFGLSNRVSAARNELQRAMTMGAHPLEIQKLQNILASLEGQANREMMQQQQQQNNMMTRLPGIGGADPYGIGGEMQGANNNLDMQILRSLLGVGGGIGGGLSSR